MRDRLFSQQRMRTRRKWGIVFLALLLSMAFSMSASAVPNAAVRAQGSEPTQGPGLEILLTAEPESLTEPGGMIVFQIGIINNQDGSGPVTIDVLADDIHGDLNGQGSCSLPQVIEPGADYQCSFETEVSASQTILLIASGLDGEGAQVSGQATVSIEIAPEDGPEAAPEIAPEVAPEPTLAPLDPWAEAFSSTTINTGRGITLQQVVISSPPQPPPGASLQRSAPSLPKPSLQSDSNLLVVPGYEWSFGCSATSAAMIAAYFDNNGFPDIYTGSTNGGVMPMNNSVWGYYDDGCSPYLLAQTPLSATRQGLDGLGSRGHVDDYWVCLDSTADDPYIDNWTQHTYADATGDFMYTNQSAFGIHDGATSFYTLDNNQELTCSYLEGMGGSYAIDGTVGFKNFYESRGYPVTDCYIQKTDNNVGPGGFSYEDFKEEIDAGQPVLFHVTGHTMVGVGYDDPDTIYVHDTWDYDIWPMTWGEYYFSPSLESFAVSVVHIGTPEIDVQGNGTSIPDGDGSPSPADDTDFGNVELSAGSAVHTFTIQNTGNGPLNLNGSPQIEISGPAAADFSAGDPTVSLVPAGGGTATFQVTFDPSAAGLREAEVTIYNMDPNENPYNFTIQGTGVTPEIGVSGSGQDIPDGDASPAPADGTDFEDINVSIGASAHTFTIENTGGLELNLTDSPAVQISGPDAGDFTVTSPPASPVAAGGGTTTFEITFDPSDTGLRQAEVSIASDDLDENPYTFAIQGTGVVTFADVPASHWAIDYIEALWDGGLTAGCSTGPLEYCPDQILNRAMSAVFMLRGEFGTAYVPPGEPWDTFADDWSLSDISWGEKWAEGMWEEAMTAGCQSDPLMYCPRRELPRVEASVFALNMLHGTSYSPPPATGTLLGDMNDPGYWGTKWAEQAYRDGLIAECGWQGSTPLFCPDDLVNRALGAYLIVMAKDLPVPTDLTKPTLTSPANTATLTDPQPTFEWNEVTGIYLYNIQIALNGNLGTTDLLVNEWVLAADVCSGGACSWQVASGLANDTYEWQVRGRDAEFDLTPWSDIWSFTINN